MNKSIANVVKNVKKGVQINGAVSLSIRLTEVVKKQLGKQYPQFFGTDLGKALEPIVVPALVSIALDNFGNSVPGNAKLKKLSHLAMQGSTAQLSSYLSTTLSPIVPELLAVIGDDVLNTATNGADDDDDD